MNPNIVLKSRNRKRLKTSLVDSSYQTMVLTTNDVFNESESRKYDGVQKYFSSPKESTNLKEEERSQTKVLDLSVKKTDKAPVINIDESYEKDIKKSFDSNLPQLSHNFFLPSFFLHNNAKAIHDLGKCDLSILWNIMMQFSLNNYNQYLTQFRENKPTENFLEENLNL